MKTIIIMLVLAGLVLCRIFYKIKEFDETIDKMEQDELNKREKRNGTN